MTHSEAMADLEFLQSFFASHKSAVVVAATGIDFFLEGCAFGCIEFAPEMSP